MEETEIMNNNNQSTSTLLGSVAILIAFSAAWAAIHSLLASRTMKQKVRERLGPGSDRWYRAFFVTFAGLSLAPIVPLFLRLPDAVLWAVGSPWRWLMRAGQAAAAIGVAGAVVQVGLSRFVGLAQLWGKGKGEPLETNRFYACVRHPMALLSILVMWLSPTMTWNQAAVYGMATLYFYVGTFLEERKLVEQFGETYEAYREEVPRLVPRPGGCAEAGGRQAPGDGGLA
jgi:protein-S-isoprenylcysteine O-methyltransferase Ste14